MGKTINIRFVVPLSDEEWGGPSIHFFKWIPEDLSDAIVINDGSKNVSISIDKSCVTSLHELTEERISNWVNILVSKLIVNVEVVDVDDDFAAFIFNESITTSETHDNPQSARNRHGKLKERYECLGVEVAQLSVKAVNRLISYARNVKGQYWLTEYKFTRDMLGNLNNRFHAKAKIDDGGWFHWRPSNVTVLNGRILPDELAIKSDEWAGVSQFVTGSIRPNLVFELLANSEQLFDGGHMRSAIIEVVSALEVSVSKFGSNAAIEMLSEYTPIDRIDIDRLGVQIRHLGLSGSIRYLIPMLLPVDVVPATVLSNCFKALEIRNNVVHQGQRDVSPNLVREVLSGVKFFCRVLDKYTNQ
ncbi:hypothetical protein [Microbulbifer mangrovi]|uniref:hypothetical protein n=1 Tax=Microbulbifer mangrovi TaxID=927787 RepID=UPI0009908C5A|nr:hypothetical protein [Microbulbifer mangrovi]